MADDKPPRELVEFADGRPGWQIRRYPGSHIWIAMRTFDRSFNARINVWPAQVPTIKTWSVTCISVHQEYAVSPADLDEAIREATFVEQTLGLAENLYGCTTRAQADGLVREVRGRQLELLRRVLDLPRGNAEMTRLRVINRACGSRIDADVLSRKSTKW